MDIHTLTSCTPLIQDHIIFPKLLNSKLLHKFFFFLQLRVQKNKLSQLRKPKTSHLTVKQYYYYLISLFAHIGYNPIEQHTILIIHIYNYIQNTGKRKMYIITVLYVRKSSVITLPTIYNGVNELTNLDL